MRTATSCTTCDLARRRLAKRRSPRFESQPARPPIPSQPWKAFDGCHLPCPVEDARSGDLVDELAEEAAHVVRSHLAGQRVRQVWTTMPGRVLFRLADGRTGDIEVLVNWDVGTALASPCKPPQSG